MRSETIIHMDPKTLISSFRERIDLALIRHLGAQGDSLSARIASVARELPAELENQLREIAGERSAADAAGESAVADFAFLCGRAVERIEALAKSRAAEDLIFMDADGRSVTDPATADLDTLARFRVARDRLLRKAADFSLKVLAITVVLVAAGFLLGLI